jgi:hypothetical protein
MWIVGCVALVAALWYLRDPAWVAGQTTGLREWRQDADGARYRWSGGHASFFVPASAPRIRIPIAIEPDATPSATNVTFTVDDVRAARVVLTDAAWHDVLIEMPPAGSRRVRRIDVRVDVTSDGNRGVKLGEVDVTPATVRSPR